MDYVDLKTFFSSMSVGSSSTSRPSTRESQNAAAVESQEVVQDGELLLCFEYEVDVESASHY